MALLVLLPAAAGAGIVSSHFGLRIAHRLGLGLRLACGSGGAAACGLFIFALSVGLGAARRFAVAFAGLFQRGTI